MQIFQELLSIKTFREGKAELEVRRQRHVLLDAQTHLQAMSDQLARYRLFAVDEEKRLYTELCARVVRLRDIEDVQLSVVGLRDQERRHEEAEAQARKTEQAEQQRLEEAKLRHQEAARMKQKFVEFARIHAEAQIKELERKEDAEMEEVAETRRDRADWEETHETEEA